MAKDERGPVLEIGRWLRGLERGLNNVLGMRISDEERKTLTARRGIYSGIADDIDHTHRVDSKGPPFTNAEVGMGRLAGSARFDKVRCYDEHSAKRMLAAAAGMECRLCMKPTEMFIAIPNEFGFNVLPGYCLVHGESMLRPYEGSTVAEKLDDAVKDKPPGEKPPELPSVKEFAEKNAWGESETAAGLMERWNKGEAAVWELEAFISRQAKKPLEVVPLWQDYEIDTDDVCTLEGFDGICLMTGDVHVETGLKMSRETARTLADRLNGILRSSDVFACCGGNDEKPPHHCSDCSDHPWEGSPNPSCMSSPATCPHAKPVVPRYYEAFGENKDSAESKRLEGVINNIVHEVLEESAHAPDCDSFDFDPEQQLGPDKPCNCWKSKP